MLELSLREIASAVNGRSMNYSGIADETIITKGISTDSRTVLPGNLFVALKGEKFNGHAYCNEARKKGAAVFLISDPQSLPEGAVGVITDDTLLGLQKLARHYRDRLDCVVVAVTGSVGKTSTREMIAAALSGSFKIHVTSMNFNNEIGLPSTILSAPADTQVLLLEMGMRQRGEIRLLSQIAQPDIAVITNIGTAHIELLGSPHSILSAKTEICEGLRDHGTLIINGDDKYLLEYVSDPKRKKWERLGMATFSHARPQEVITDYRIYADQVTMSRTGIALKAIVEDSTCTESVQVAIQSFGKHQVKNALISLLCGYILGAKLSKIRDSLSRFTPPPGRGNIILTNHFTVVDDSYNASPESMEAAFESVRLMAGAKRKIAALGGMLELGPNSPELHFRVGASAAREGIDVLFACGDEVEFLVSGALSETPEMPVYTFKNTEDLSQALVHFLKNEDVVLIKASHAFGFERIAEAIVKNDGIASDHEGRGDI